MRKMKWVAVTALLALVSISCQLFAPTGNKDGVLSGDAKRMMAEPPVFVDLEAPLPSPGAASLRVLASWDTSAAGLQGEVEAAERTAMNAFIKQLTAQLASDVEPALPAVLFASSRDANPAPASLILVSNHQASIFQDGSTETSHDASLAAGLVSGLSNLISDQMPAGINKSPTLTTTEGDSTVTMSGDIGKSTDGSTKFGMGIKTETVKNGSATSTDFQASVDGQRCPNAEGQVSFTMKVRLGAGTDDNSYTQDLTAFVRAVVDENAQIVTTTIDVIQATQQEKNGRVVYVETGQTVKYNEDDKASLRITNARVVQHTDNATRTDIGDFSAKGHDAAFAMGRTALLAAQDKWREGGCVKIDAALPTKVGAGSTTSIPVTVIHKFDGSTVSSKLEAVLSGEASLDPTSLAKTPGTLTYTAPGENGKSATIQLTATSRRGIATLRLTTGTGGNAYHISGTIDDASMDGVTCDSSQPFTIGGTLQFTFTPASPTAGTYTYTGPYDAAGQGPYVINGDGTMLVEGNGCVMGGYCASYSHIWNAVPIDSCP